ncbi:MAG: hypothetical protein Q8Q08_01110 [Candidatus Omnitrophota bacterium]|nr:hypothetical protein [Candidatus Omnitrophota bacterium]MDZ4241273.1 hypothetical protein [Candidatus Omnitrophota bacterium]
MTKDQREKTRCFLELLFLFGIIGVVFAFLSLSNAHYRAFPPPMPSQGGYDGYLVKHESPLYLVYVLALVAFFIFHAPFFLLMALVTTWFPQAVFPGGWPGILTIGFDALIWAAVFYAVKARAKPLDPGDETPSHKDRTGLSG